MGDKIIRKMSEEETDRLLKEEFFEEADLIEKALFSDDLENSSENDRKETEEETEEAYQKLINKLKEGGIYREEDENVRESKIISDVFPEIKSEESAAGKITDIRANSGKVAELREFTGENTKSAVRSRRMHGIARAAAIGVVCVLGVFAASMTGEANRRYFINTMKYMTGNDTRLIIGNDENNEDVNESEYEAREKVEETLGVKIPEFWYRPDTFEFYNYEVDGTLCLANVRYQYNSQIILLLVRGKSEFSNSGNFSVHGDVFEEITFEDENINVAISEIKDTNDKRLTYVAKWIYQDTFYQISGEMEKEELMKLLKNMRY